MRYVLALWAIPMALFWGWYYLSLNDLNFGYIMLSRQVHDLAFGMYGDILGIDPQTIPPLVMRACVFDTLFLACFWAFRRRREIARWWRGDGSPHQLNAGPATGPILPAE